MISFVDSITAPLSLLNALIVTVGQRKNEEVPETFSELERVWSQYSVFGKRKMSKRVVVIGGGAAGMMAAIAAAGRGAQVTLIEPNERLGKKLNITGKGRCNVTNNCTEEALLQNIPRNGKFLYSSFFRL